MKSLKDLKQMISEPSSKEWFAKHGLPKSNHMEHRKEEAKRKLATNKKIGEARTRALTRKIHEKNDPNHAKKAYKRIHHEMKKDENDYERYANGQSHSLTPRKLKEFKED